MVLRLVLTQNLKRTIGIYESTDKIYFIPFFFAVPGVSMGRMPSAIKTNIKAAATSHPYQRP